MPISLRGHEFWLLKKEARWAVLPRVKEKKLHFYNWLKGEQVHMEQQWDIIQTIIDKI